MGVSLLEKQNWYYENHQRKILIMRWQRLVKNMETLRYNIKRETLIEMFAFFETLRIYLSGVDGIIKMVNNFEVSI